MAKQERKYIRKAPLTKPAPTKEPTPAKPQTAQPDNLTAPEENTDIAEALNQAQAISDENNPQNEFGPNNGKQTGPKKITDDQILMLKSHGLSNSGIARALGCTPSNINVRLAHLLPAYNYKQIDEMLPKVTKTKAYQILSTINAELVDKAGLGERVNAVKKLTETSQSLTGKNPSANTVNIQVNIDKYFSGGGAPAVEDVVLDVTPGRDGPYWGGK